MPGRPIDHSQKRGRLLRQRITDLETAVGTPAGADLYTQVAALDAEDTSLQSQINALDVRVTDLETP